jgi:ABC-type transport system involved in multi-copper enzyme maturation permease subunit
VNIREVLARLDRLQHATPFKVAMSLVLVGAAVTLFTIYVVAVTSPGANGPAMEAGQQAAQAQSAIDSGTQVLQEIADRRASPANVALGLSLITGVALMIVWLGLTLTYAALLAIATGVAYPLALLGYPGSARMLAGIVVLTAAFMAILQSLRLLFSGPGPVFGIARNVLIEAVRMKVAVVFIILLIFALAALPGLLDTTTPLRYRVQSFLQYGTGGSYWIIAILILFFSVGTVAFEQRDRQIWQTMTKPVQAWQYILGKWLGVVALAAALLTVCCAGIFLFTEYLRQQPAMGEDRQAMIGGSGPTEDRVILETQVLSARKVVEPTLPMGPNDREFLEDVRAFILNKQEQEPDFAKDQETFEKVKADLYRDYEQWYRSIAPGVYRDFVFEGMQDAARRGGMVTFRYRVDSGGNPPGILYKLTFAFGDYIHPPLDVSLGPSHTLSLYPSVIEPDGTVTLTVFNGELMPGPEGEVAVIPNPESINFPPGGIQLSYSVSSYQMNFVRVACVLWLKLAFLAMVGIAAGTFLSFPVACLVAFAVFIGAESAGFIAESLQYYEALDYDENVVYWKIPVRAMGLAVATAFKTYAELRPTTRLVDGRLLSWGDVMWGASLIALWTGVLFTLATAIFRRRELATYSGQ